SAVRGRARAAGCRWCGAGPRPYRTDRGLQLVAEATFEDVPSPDVIVVPGGTGTLAALEDRRLVDWIRRADATSTWTTSVCTGALLLGAGGLLEGWRATTHWAYMDRLADYGAEATSERVVEQGKVITSAGVSSGIDMAPARAAPVAAGRGAHA